MTYWYRPYTRDEGTWSLNNDRVGDAVAIIVGEVRSETCDFPICYVHGHTAGTRIVNALNALELATTARGEARNH